MLQKRLPNAKQIEREHLYREMGLSDNEYEQVKRILKRLPNYTETGIFSVMWSEHCSYKSSKHLLKKLPTDAPYVLQGPGEGAGAIDIGDGHAIVFKIESHNHPAAIDPFEAAATGVGGIARDVFSMGAKPIAALNSLRFGRLNSKRSRTLLTEVVNGIAHYGNTIGVPIVGGEIQFDDCYEENPLVNAMIIGLAKQDALQKGIAAGIGNVVIYAGAATGRDGIHGATFASDEIADDTASAVAIGNPQLGKRLMEACLDVIHSDVLVGMQDMGAAGLTSSASEMASKAGTGIEMNLDFVPTCETYMTPYELMLSETQERMLLVVKKGGEQEIIQLFAKHDVHAVAIGKVIAEKQLRLLQHGEVVASIPIHALTEATPTYTYLAKERTEFREFQGREAGVPAVDNYTELLKKLLQQSTIASKEWVYGQFNTKAQGNTITGPGSDAAVVRIPETDKAIAITTDCNSRYLYLDPETGGKIAIAEATRNLVASGAKPIALTDGLNYGNPHNPEVFWQMEKSIDGICAACDVLGTPIVSGNVSLYNQSKGKPIFPTPIIGMVGLFHSLNDITPSRFQTPDDLIYLIGETKAEFGGSELQYLLEGAYTGRPPEIDLQLEARRQNQLIDAIHQGIITSAHDLAEGGLAVALAECVINTNGLGLDVAVTGDPAVQLFSESQSRFLVSVDPDNREQFESIVEDVQQIGRVTDSGEMFVRKPTGEIIIQEDVQVLSAKWKHAIPSMLK